MFIKTKIQNNENIKNIGVFMWVVSVLTLLKSFSDPWILIDVLMVASMAYFAYYKSSRKSVYCAGSYFLLDTFLFLDMLIDNPVAIVVRAAILFWLLSASLSIFNETSNAEENQTALGINR